jgi:hypothetical protein
MAQYKTGTINLTNGSAAVTGNGTIWTTALNGKWLKVEGVAADYRILSVTDYDTLTLEQAYTGATASQAHYHIVQDLTSNFLLPEISAGDREWEHHITEALRGIDYRIQMLTNMLAGISPPGDFIWDDTGGGVWDDTGGGIHEDIEG